MLLHYVYLNTRCTEKKDIKSILLCHVVLLGLRQTINLGKNSRHPGVSILQNAPTNTNS